jgi:arginine/lysine/ornithine decarboxylase
VDLGADMCCDSAHKTLPCLTGGAYLHVSKNANSYFKQNAKEALSVFASTSPSYLILQSLDETNKYLSEAYEKKLSQTVSNVGKLKKSLIDLGFKLSGNEPLKLTVAPKSFGYTGRELSDILESKNITCEFSDKDFLVLMFTPEIDNEDFRLIEKAFLEIERKDEIFVSPPSFRKAEKKISVREALLSRKELVPVETSLGRIIASPSVGCPPAVPIAMCGEIVDENVVKAFLYYGVDKCFVIK